MKTNRFPLILIFIAILFNACKSSSKIEAPAALYEATEYEPKISVINFPIEVDMATLEKILNENFKGLIYEDNNLDDDNMMIKAWKVRDFKIRCDNNAYAYSVPLKLWIKAGWKVEQLGVSLSDFREFEAEINLKFRTKFTVNKNWEVISNTTIEGYEWIKKPIIKLGTFNIPVTSIADALIKYNKKSFQGMIDESVKDYAPLREYAQELWEWSQEPFEVSEEYKTWLKFSPVEIAGTPIVCHGNKLTMAVHLKSNIETVVGKIPEVKVNKALPFYKEIRNTDQNFEINMLTMLEYHTVDSLAKSMLIGQTFREGKYHATILDVNFYGHGGKLVIGVKLKGTFNGNVYFMAVPYYDRETASIRLKDFDFDFRTKNVLINSSKWLYKNTFRNMIASKMVFSMADYIDDIKANIQPYLTEMDMHENLLAKCTLDDILIDDIFLVHNGLKIAVTFKGNLKIKIK